MVAILLCVYYCNFHSMPARMSQPSIRMDSKNYKLQSVTFECVAASAKCVCNVRAKCYINHNVREKDKILRAVATTDKRGCEKTERFDLKNWVRKKMDQKNAGCISYEREKKSFYLSYFSPTSEGVRFFLPSEKSNPLTVSEDTYYISQGLTTWSRSALLPFHFRLLLSTRRVHYNSAADKARDKS